MLNGDSAPRHRSYSPGETYLPVHLVDLAHCNAEGLVVAVQNHIEAYKLRAARLPLLAILCMTLPFAKLSGYRCYRAQLRTIKQTMHNNADRSAIGHV